jgi:hypothetical protein
MTVGELQEILDHYPDDMEVTTRRYVDYVYLSGRFEWQPLEREDIYPGDTGLEIE